MSEGRAAQTFEKILVLEGLKRVQYETPVHIKSDLPNKTGNYMCTVPVTLWVADNANDASGSLYLPNKSNLTSIPTVLSSGSSAMSCGRGILPGMLAEAIHNEAQHYVLPSTSSFVQLLSLPSLPWKTSTTFSIHPPPFDFLILNQTLFLCLKPSYQQWICMVIATQFKDWHLCTLFSLQTIYGPISSGPSLSPLHSILTLLWPIHIPHLSSIIIHSSELDWVYLICSNFLQDSCCLTNLKANHTTIFPKELIFSGFLLHKHMITCMYSVEHDCLSDRTFNGWKHIR